MMCNIKQSNNRVKRTQSELPFYLPSSCGLSTFVPDNSWVCCGCSCPLLDISQPALKSLPAWADFCLCTESTFCFFKGMSYICTACSKLIQSVISGQINWSYLTQRYSFQHLNWNMAVHGVENPNCFWFVLMRRLHICRLLVSNYFPLRCIRLHTNCIAFNALMKMPNFKCHTIIQLE